MPQSVCLNMIVRDESTVIQRCLASVKPYVNHWIIVDTGSTDGTKELARKAMEGVPGELYERPWKDFGHNRTEALRLAEGRGDYILWLDADDEFRVPNGWTWPDMQAEAVDVDTVLGTTRYARVALVSTKLPWRWVGVLHEYLEAGRPPSRGRLEGAQILARTDGARGHDPLKYQRDAQTLEAALVEEPGNTRYRFYLAQSYRDAGDYSKALTNYNIRANAGGWDEEVYISHLEAGRCSERLGLPPFHSLLLAHQARPCRPEALVELARIHRTRCEHHLSYLFASKAVSMPPSHDRLFVDTLAPWRALDECAVAAYFTGRRDECRRLCEAALASPLLPPSETPRVRANLCHASSV